MSGKALAWVLDTLAIVVGVVLAELLLDAWHRQQDARGGLE